MTQILEKNLRFITEKYPRTLLASRTRISLEEKCLIRIFTLGINAQTGEILKLGTENQSYPKIKNQDVQYLYLRIKEKSGQTQWEFFLGKINKLLPAANILLNKTFQKYFQA